VTFDVFFLILAQTFAVDVARFNDPAKIDILDKRIQLSKK